MHVNWKGTSRAWSLSAHVELIYFFRQNKYKFKNKSQNLLNLPTILSSTETRFFAYFLEQLLNRFLHNNYITGKIKMVTVFPFSKVQE